MIRYLLTFSFMTALPVLARAETKTSLKLHIDADTPKVELFRLNGQSVGQGYAAGQSVTVVTTYYEPVCKTPCDEVIPTSYPNQYFLAGDGVSVTDAFSLESYTSAATLKVHAGSAFGLWGGYMLTGVGAAFAMSGALTYYAIPDTLGTGLHTAGAYMLIGGLVAAVPGIVLWVMNRTQYEILQNGGAPAETAPGAPRSSRRKKSS